MSGATWFIGDLHFGHQKVSEIRGFATTEGHDRHLMSRWSKQVHPNDTVWVLGDLSSGSSVGERAALAIISELPGTKHLIGGNHDSVSSIHRNGYKKFAEFSEVFASIQQFGRFRMNGFDVLISHYPYLSQGDGPGRGEPRYTQFRLPDLGAPLVHAHTHHTNPTGGSKTGRELCVSWDAWGRMANGGDISKWLMTLDNEEAKA